MIPFYYRHFSYQNLLSCLTFDSFYRLGYLGKAPVNWLEMRFVNCLGNYVGREKTSDTVFLHLKLLINSNEQLNRFYFIYSFYFFV